MSQREIPYYEDYISQNLFRELGNQIKPVAGVPGLRQIGDGGGLESPEALRFLCELYDKIKAPLNKVLNQRILDRQFIDQRTKACFELNRSLKTDFLSPDYQTIFGQEDQRGRIILGPKNDFYCRPGGGRPIAKLPAVLDENHVTLFGPPDDAKLSVNAMNAYHRKLKGEPTIVAKLLVTSTSAPKWGADDEDSKTPLRKDLVAAGVNLTGCMEHSLSFTDPKTQKQYQLEKDHLAVPIKRFPGLALPTAFLFYRDNPLPLHLYDFALHLFKNWHQAEALSFYVPKLETEEEAQYIHTMVAIAEKMMKALHPEYALGTIRLFIVLENPRIIFRVNEVMDALEPYFAGASLGWHDYLGSTARLFKEDANYRIPVKADPNIVIKYIKASHNLLTDVVGSRGGIKIGGMYGILPTDSDLFSPSFQVTMKGYIKDVVTQMKRGLSGFWVAHPDFVRIGLALVEAWKFYQQKDRSKLDLLVTSLLKKDFHQEILDFIHGPDIVGLDIQDPLYPRSLIVADIAQSTFVANNDPEEIRYNVFQSLQYLADWLAGNGCVALPAQIDGVPVRVMDDLATAERSRWEVWHEIHHGRFSVEEFLKIVHEEMHFIRKDLSNGKKIVQVKWDERTAKWYPIAMKLMIQLMTSDQPAEFATELLLPLTVDAIRESTDPWQTLQKIDPKKYSLKPDIESFNEFFAICGSLRFAHEMAQNRSVNLPLAEKLIKSFSLDEVIEAAGFHGNIGESKRTLDEVASREQALVLKESQDRQNLLLELGEKYREKFGMKFLISAQGKSAQEIQTDLQTRLGGTFAQELDNARTALWQISLKRLQQQKSSPLQNVIAEALKKHQITGAMVCLSTHAKSFETICVGEGVKGKTPVNATTLFELASLSKTLASCFAMEYFRKAQIPLSTSVNSLLKKTNSPFRIQSKDASWADQVTLQHLMNHTALNMHYVNGIPAGEAMPNVQELLNGNASRGYQPIGLHQAPGRVFSYSGGGFLVLEHLIESLEKKSIQEITNGFFADLGLKHLSFEQKNQTGFAYAHGYTFKGEEIEGTRKMFPAFAAGAMGTASDVAAILQALSTAYRSAEGSGPISHDTAVQMLHGRDQGSRTFMGANMGLGVFTTEAGPNRLALHQGANDGFRSLFVHCYDGPDRDQGFVVFCNGEFNGVLFIAEVARALLQELKWNGVNLENCLQVFEASSVPQEQVVNQAYKDLIFSAFEPDLPEKNARTTAADPLTAYNLAAGGTLLKVSNQGFARAENLLSPYLPSFDPELYGRQGKIMDSWETVRHNQNPCDELLFQLKKPSAIHYASVSTQFHLGNQAQAILIEGLDQNQQWHTLVPKTKLDGHALKHFKTASVSGAIRTVKVSLFPDGGLTRLSLYDETLPENEKAKFLPADQAQSIVFKDSIPHAVKPLTPKYQVTPIVIQKNWAAIPAGAEVDIACSAFGGRIVHASNEHYGPAIQVISPYPAINMFDGFESARSREKNHYEEVIIELGKESPIHRIEMDFTYFKNNNPLEVSLQGLCKDHWIILVERTNIKAYAGNFIHFPIHAKDAIKQLKVLVFPDGGVNRIRVFSKN